MKERLLFLALSIPLLSIAIQAQRLNPPYLAQFPSVEQIQTDVRGVDAMETAAKQAGIFSQLVQFIAYGAYTQRRSEQQFTPDERRLSDMYYSASRQISGAYVQKVAGADKQRWDGLYARYNTDRFLLDEVFKKYLTPAARSAVYAAARMGMPTYTPEGSTLTPSAAELARASNSTTPKTTGSTAPPAARPSAPVGVNVTTASQEMNPPYLSQFPSVERVKAEVKGSDPVDTASRQQKAFYLLNQMILDVAGNRVMEGQLTRDEDALTDRYAEANRWYQYKENAPPPQDEARWNKLVAFYEKDPAFFDDLLKRFFSPEFRAGYYRFKGKQPPPSATSQPSSVRSQPTAGPTAPPRAQPSTSAGVSAEAYKARGDEYFFNEDYAKATEEYKKAIALKPSLEDHLVELFQNLGRINNLEGDHKLALSAYRQSLALKPNDTSAHIGLGDTYFTLKQYGDALAAYQQAILLKPEPDDLAAAYRGIGDAYKEQRETQKATAAYQQALTVYQRLLRVKPKEGYLHYGLGHTYLGLGQKRQALKVYKTLLTIDKGWAEELLAEINKSR